MIKANALEPLAGARESEDPMSESIRYFIFDVESVTDGELVRKVRYPGEELSDSAAIQKYREELMETRGSDFIPHTFQVPISVVIGKVTEDFQLVDLVALDVPTYRPHVITDQFWKGWKHYGQPTLVTFNGRGYDLPVLELAAYRYGITLPEWFNVQARSYEQARHRYNIQSHIDLMDLVSNFGASRVSGGLNLLAHLIGKPGKTGVDGSMVQGFYDEGRVEEINDYCRCDVLDTYFVFLRSRVMIGRLDIETEQRLVSETKGWLEERRETCPAYAHYLDHWGDWTAPGADRPSNETVLPPAEDAASSQETL